MQLAARRIAMASASRHKIFAVFLFLCFVLVFAFVFVFVCWFFGFFLSRFKGISERFDLERNCCP
jgi:hypothetical protein